MTDQTFPAGLRDASARAVNKLRPMPRAAEAGLLWRARPAREDRGREVQPRHSTLEITLGGPRERGVWQSRPATPPAGTGLAGQPAPAAAPRQKTSNERAGER